MPVSSKGGIKFFQYTQSAASTTWTIYHGFGKKPLIDININLNGVVQKAFPQSLVQVDENTVTITWSSPRTGYVTFASDEAV